MMSGFRFHNFGMESTCLEAQGLGGQKMMMMMMMMILLQLKIIMTMLHKELGI